MPEIKIENLILRAKDKLLCQNLSLTIKSGEFWGILGCNGSGKTTLLHSLAGINKTESGQIFIDQQSLFDINRKKLAKKLAILLQNQEYIFPNTVLETALIGRYPYLNRWQQENSNDRKIAEQALAIVELNALQSEINTSLSGGEKQRLALAMILTQNPEIYLLDEPLNHLDLRHQYKILNHFKKISQEENKIGVMASHDINHVSHFCTHVLVLYGDGHYDYGPTQQMINSIILEKVFHQKFLSVPSEYGDIFYMAAAENVIAQSPHIVPAQARDQ